MASYDLPEVIKVPGGSDRLGTVQEEHEHTHCHEVHSLKVHSLKDCDPTDARNPRNWSPFKKRMLFTALISSSVLADGAMTWGATLIVTQAVDWNISITHSSTSLNYGILLQGFGGIFAVPLIEACGRLPVWFWTQIITMFMVLGATLSNSWGVFTIFRSLQGLFGTVPQVVGLPIIHDMYEPEEWPWMINIWGTTFLVGPFVGPALAGYILDGSQNQWNISFGVLTALYGVSTLLIILFGYETYYGRQLMQHPSPAPLRARVCSFFGIDLILLIFKLPLLLTGIATMINFCWPIGITTTIDTFLHSSPYLFNTVQASSMRFAGVIGALGGYIFGYFFNEWIYNRHRKSRSHRNNDNSEAASEHSDLFTSSTWRSEYRLHGVWFPIGSMVCGLLTYGLTLHFQRHWIGLAFGWLMVNIGMVASTVAITAYALEKYPSHATSVSAIINMWRTCGGFSVGYFQASWIAIDGVGVVFGIQAAIVAAGIVLTIVPLVVLAKKRSAVGSDAVHQARI